jgi:dienelactone hydrolase
VAKKLFASFRAYPAWLRETTLELTPARRAPQVGLAARIGLLVMMFVAVGGNTVSGESDEVVYKTKPETLKGFLCRPSGTGPFPAVMYNHGGVGNTIGGAPKETCEALAAAGFVGFAPIRRQTQSMAGHPEDVRAGFDYLIRLDYVDCNRVAILGFSRGGALTFMAAARGVPAKAAVIMASAIPPPQSGFTLADAVNIRVPVLLLVAKNDTGSRKTIGQNTLEGMERMSAALTEAGNVPKLIVYPSYRGDGHEMFFEIGTYWKDVVEFLKKHL